VQSWGDDGVPGATNTIDIEVGNRCVSCTVQKLGSRTSELAGQNFDLSRQTEI